MGLVGRCRRRRIAGDRGRRHRGDRHAPGQAQGGREPRGALPPRNRESSPCTADLARPAVRGQARPTGQETPPGLGGRNGGQPSARTASACLAATTAAVETTAAATTVAAAVAVDSVAAEEAAAAAEAAAGAPDASAAYGVAPGMYDSSTSTGKAFAPVMPLMTPMLTGFGVRSRSGVVGSDP